MEVLLSSHYKLSSLYLHHVFGLYKKVWSREYLTVPMGYKPYKCFLQALIRYILIVTDKRINYFVIQDIHDEVVGMFRYTNHGDFVTVGYGLCTEARGLGLIDDCLHSLRHWTNKTIYAIVYSNNFHSMHVLVRNGFERNSFDLEKNKVSYRRKQCS